MMLVVGVRRGMEPGVREKMELESEAEEWSEVVDMCYVLLLLRGTPQMAGWAVKPNTTPQTPGTETGREPQHVSRLARHI